MNAVSRRTSLLLLIWIALLTLVTDRPPQAQAPAAGPLAATVWADRIHAGWVGKVAAGSGALPTEMWPRERIREKYGDLRTPPQPPTSRGPLDDTTLALLGWWTAQEHGAGFTSANLAAEWVAHLTDADLKGGGFGREFLDALTQLRQGAAPPIRSGTPRAEWIAAQMRAEIWGMLAPGDPQRAAAYAERDAAVFNTGNAVYGAQFVAALASRLMVDPGIPAAVAAARALLPADSALARVVGDAIAWHTEVPQDWGAAWDRFAEKYRDRSLEQHFARWSNEWLVETGGWPEAELLAQYAGQPSVLRTHPFSVTEPARLTTKVAVPATGGQLRLRVTCNDRPADVDWLLRVRLGETSAERPIRQIDGHVEWQQFTFDLQPWAGQTVTIVLENAVSGKFGWEAGFWTVPQLMDAQGQALHGQRPAGQPHRYPLSFSPPILPETFSVLTGLLYGEGDFRRSVSIATMCGFDTDCNAGTVGCLLGLRNGLEGIPPEWRDPVADNYDVQVTGLPRHWTIADLARQMAATGAMLAQGQAPAPAGAAPVQPAPAPAASEAPKPLDPPEGFGAKARGGEGGRTILVTTLADSGPGSLREALAADGPRLIRFAVAGTIALQSRLRCEHGRVTIEGGSAPGDGITLLNHGVQFRGDCDDIIVRNLRIRVTTGGDQGDALLFWGNQGGTVERVLVDHCSLLWATDEVVNTWGNVRDLTVQWTIIAEARLPHSKGWLSGVGTDRVSIHHCLFAGNGDRNPKLEGGTYDFRNNVVYNWGSNNGAKLESGARVNIIGNCFVPGPDSRPQDGCLFPQDPDKGTRLYVEGNLGPYTPNGAGDPWANVTWFEPTGARWQPHRPAPEPFRATAPFACPPVATQPAAEALGAVLQEAGACVRDADDRRVVEAVRTRTGQLGPPPR